MYDTLVEIIKAHPEGIDSLQLAREGLKFQNPVQSLAHKTVNSILKKDPRVFYGPDELWYPATTSDSETITPLVELPWAAVYILTDQDGARGRRPLHVSVWTAEPEPAMLLDEWLVNPATLSPDEQQLFGGMEETFSEENRADVIAHIATALDERLPVYLSAYQQSLLTRESMRTGETLNDDSVLLSTLMRAVNIPPPRPLDIAGCYRGLVGHEPVLSPAIRYGQRLAECVRAAAERLQSMGIRSRAELDEREQRDAAEVDWKNKAFSREEIFQQPLTPGVYGFRSRSGTYLYIGKARNLRRRLGSYFRNTEESPRKLQQLRSEAYDFIIHPCGSELESLILEHRLIAKHRPSLNTQTVITERKGTFETIQDCIVLLPHQDPERLMTFWFRSGQKTALVPLYRDLHDLQEQAEALDAFFFSKQTPIAATDFPEEEIASRWLRRHREELELIPVFALSGAEEVIAALKTSVHELSQPPYSSQ